MSSKVTNQRLLTSILRHYSAPDFPTDGDDSKACRIRMNDFFVVLNVSIDADIRDD